MTAHRGVTVDGFPNLFFLLGPNTGTGHMSVVYMAEAQAGLRARRPVRARLPRRRRAGADGSRPRTSGPRRSSAARRARSGSEGGCASWYLDDEGRNTTLWPDYTFKYACELRRFDPAEHVFTPARVPVAA